MDLQQIQQEKLKVDDKLLSQPKSPSKRKLPPKRKKSSHINVIKLGMNGLVGLDLNEGDLLMQTYKKENFQRLGTPTQSKLNINLNMTLQNNSSLRVINEEYNNFNNLLPYNEDFQQENEMFNSTFDNLLQFKGGKDLKEAFQRQIKQSKIRKYGQYSKKAMQKPVIIPKFKGYQEGGSTLTTSLALNSNSIKQLQNNQNRLESSKSSNDSNLGFAVSLNKEQRQIIKNQEQDQMKLLFQNIKKRENDLHRLSNFKSLERSRRTLNDQNNFFYHAKNSFPLDQSTLSLKEIRKDFRPRTNSESQIHIGELVELRTIKTYFKIEKQQSSALMIELRDIIYIMLQDVSKVTYYQLILNDTGHLIDFFVDTNNQEIIQIAIIKEIIQKFEQLKSDMNRKLSSTSASLGISSEKDCSTSQIQSDFETESNHVQKSSFNNVSQSLSISEIRNMKFVFNQIRFILTKFGRVVTYLNKINSGWKGYMIKNEMHQKVKNQSQVENLNPNLSKQHPRIQRIIESQRKNTHKRGVLDRQDSNEKVKEMLKNQGKILSQPEIIKQFEFDEKRLHPARVKALNKHNLSQTSAFEIIDLSKMMNLFPVDLKINIIFGYHKLQLKKWKAQYDKQRMQNIPSVLCRACDKQFYADMSQLHNQFCTEKIQKIKSQNEVNLLFMNLSTKATQAMVIVDRNWENQQSRVVIGTPTLQRRHNNVNQSNQSSLQQINQSLKRQQFTQNGRAFSICNASKQSPLISKKNVAKETKINPLLAYSLNLTQIQTLNDQNSQRQETKSQKLEVIQEREPGDRGQQKLQGKLEACDDSQNIVDIADLQFPDDQRVKNLIKRYDDVFSLTHSSIPSVLSQLPQLAVKQKASDDIMHDFQVKNQDNSNRKEQIKMLKNHVSQIMCLKDRCMQLKNEKSLENAFSIKLKNYARNVQKKQLLQKANQKSLLEKRLTVMLGNQIRFRKQKEQRQEKLKRMHMNLTPERQELLNYRFIKFPPRINISNAMIQKANSQSVRKLQENSMLSNFDILSQNQISQNSIQNNLFFDRQANTIDRQNFPSPINHNRQKNEQSQDNNSKSDYSHRYTHDTVNKSGVNSRKRAKKELIILETLKNMAQKSFEMSQINFLFGQQIQILQIYRFNLENLQTIAEFKKFDNVVIVFTEQFIESINKKIEALQNLLTIELKLSKTLPLSQIEAIEQSLKQYDSAFEMFESAVDGLQKIFKTQAVSSKNTPRVKHSNKTLQINMYDSFDNSKIIDDDSVFSQKSRRSSTLYSRSSQLSEFDSEDFTKKKVTNQNSQFKKLKQNDNLKEEMSDQIQNLISEDVQFIPEKNLSKQNSQRNILIIDKMTELPFREKRINEYSGDIFYQTSIKSERIKNEPILPIQTEQIYLESKIGQLSSAAMSPIRVGEQFNPFMRPKQQFEKSKFRDKYMNSDNEMEDDQSQSFSSQNQQQQTVGNKSVILGCGSEIFEEIEEDDEYLLSERRGSMTVNLPKSGLPLQAYSEHECLNNSCDIELNDSDDSDSVERIQEHKNQVMNLLHSKSLRTLSNNIDLNRIQSQNTISFKDLQLSSKPKQLFKLDAFNHCSQSDFLVKHYDAQLETEMGTPSTQNINNIIQRSKMLTNHRQELEKQEISNYLSEVKNKRKAAGQYASVKPSSPKMLQENNIASKIHLDIDSDMPSSIESSGEENRHGFGQHFFKYQQSAAQVDADEEMKEDEANGISLEHLASLKKEACAPQPSSLIISFKNKLAEMIQKYKNDESEQELQQDKSTVEHQQFQFSSVKSYNSQGCDSKKDTLVIKPRPSQLQKNQENNQIDRSFTFLETHQNPHSNLKNQMSFNINTYQETVEVQQKRHQSHNIVVKGMSAGMFQDYQEEFELDRKTQSDLIGYKDVFAKYDSQEESDMKKYTKEEKENIKQMLLSDQDFGMRDLHKEKQMHPQLFNHQSRKSQQYNSLGQIQIEKLKEEDKSENVRPKTKYSRNFDQIGIGQIGDNSNSSLSRHKNSNANAVVNVSIKSDLQISERSGSVSNFSGDSSKQSESDDSIEIVSPKDIKFNSLHIILDSERESCSLDKINKIEAKVTINDFILIKSLASGAYGKVILSRKKNTKDMFAIKVLEIAKMIEKNVEDTIMNERNILNGLNTDFITRGVYTFKSQKYLYMVMEYMKGGDLANLLENAGYLDQEMARYYIAQLVLALEQLHLGGVIHRDLKPDNILIDKYGHIKLTDFGLSQNQQTVKELISQSKSPSEAELESPNNDEKDSFTRKRNSKQLPRGISKLEKRMSIRLEAKKNRCVGTADYIAPEVIKGQAHTFRLDFWSLGIIVYELLTGSLPFNAESPEQIFRNALARNIEYPPIGTEDGQITPEAHSFIEALLQPEPFQRLGSNGIQDIKDHPFFDGLDWDTVMTQQAPFLPVGRDIDTIYFPKANDKDDDIRAIIDDQIRFSSTKIDKKFQDFDGTCYQTLFQINQQKAADAMKRHKKKSKLNNQKK